MAEYIHANGGTYLFGNSTCSKRWDELVEEEEAQGGDISIPFFHTVDEGDEDCGDDSY